MNDPPMIDPIVFSIWYDEIDFTRKMNEEEAARILAWEKKYSVDQPARALRIAGISPAEFTDQWNWLAIHQPEDYMAIPPGQRLGCI